MQKWVYILSVLVAILSALLARVYIDLALNGGVQTFYEPNAWVRIIEAVIYSSLAIGATGFAIGFIKGLKENINHQQRL